MPRSQTRGQAQRDVFRVNVSFLYEAWRGGAEGWEEHSVLGVRIWTDSDRTTGADAYPLAVDDAALVAAARTDPEAFARLYDRYVRRIYHYCSIRLGSRERAEDATSEVFLHALQALPTFRGGVFAAWLFQISHNVVQNAQRRRPIQSLDLAADLPDAGPSPDHLAETRLQQEAVRAALNTLPDQQRSAVELQLAGWSDEEIGRVLGKRGGAVRMLRYRAMEELRRSLADGGEEGSV